MPLIITSKKNWSFLRHVFLNVSWISEFHHWQSLTFSENTAFASQTLTGSNKNECQVAPDSRKLGLKKPVSYLMWQDHGSGMNIKSWRRTHTSHFTHRTVMHDASLSFLLTTWAEFWRIFSLQSRIPWQIYRFYADVLKTPNIYWT